MSIYIIAYIVFAVASAILHYGHTLAFWWREFESLQKDEGRWTEIVGRALAMSVVTLIAPPLGWLVTGGTLGFKHGLLYRYPGTK